MDSINGTAVAAQCAAAGMPVTAAEADQLAQFLNLLQRWNQVFNLTAIRGAAAMIQRHLIESLALRPLLQGGLIADVGSGAGLPGLPLAVVESSRRFTLIESRAKRVRFLRHVAGELKLRNLTVSHGRVEDLRCAEPFDTVLARAVAPPGELLPMIRHLTRPGSIVIVLAGQQALGRVPPMTAFAPRMLAAELGRRVHGEILCFERTGA
jgi:16S rRNA (guanine527-N7)-methyltransferase